MDCCLESIFVTLIFKMFTRPYPERMYSDSGDTVQLENDLYEDEQMLLWHEDSKPGTLV